MINFDRATVKAPDIKKSYRTQPIYDALENLFYNKCYLCETQRPDPRNFEIEHFIAHGGDETLKYSWANLYLACGGTCNQYKGNKEILNPCNPKEDVEQLIKYEFTIELTPEFYPAEPENKKAVITCQLLHKIHNGDDAKSMRKTFDLRQAIQIRADQLKNAIITFYRSGKSGDDFNEHKALEKIKQICSRQKPYTMLMRTIVIQHMKSADITGIFD